jgi:hypothetical protein
LREDTRRRFSFSGIVFEEYNATVTLSTGRDADPAETRYAQIEDLSFVIISGYHFRKRTTIMPIRQNKSLSEYRRRLKRRGVVRLEVHVRKEDASLVRSVVTALSDPSRESETRAMLRERFGGSKAAGLKALLVSAPLEGIDLSRQRDFGRDVEL